MLDIYCTNWGHADINYVTYLGLEHWLLGLALLDNIVAHTVSEA